jgi:hypothetical protein
LFSEDDYNQNKRFQDSQAEIIKLAKTIRLISIRIIIILVSNIYCRGYSSSRGSTINSTSLFKISMKFSTGFLLLGKYTKNYNNQGITKNRRLRIYIPYI